MGLDTAVGVWLGYGFDTAVAAWLDCRLDKMAEVNKTVQLAALLLD